MSLKKKIICLLRHGERQDYQPNIIPEKIKLGIYDTELTQNGIEQAYKAGTNLKEFLMTNEEPLNYNKLNINVVSSPFARCIITSKYFLRGLDLHKKTIYIEKGLSEHLNPKHYPDLENDYILSLKKPNEECKKVKKFLKEMGDQSFVEKSFTEMPVYPEDHEQCFNRFKIAFDIILNRYFSDIKTDILVLTTHFLALQIFSDLYSKEEGTLPLEYCLMLLYSYKKDTNNEPLFIKKIIV